MGLYQLKAGTKDPQSPHDLDEIYHITRGKAEIQIGAKSYQLGPGSIVFVRAEVNHKFHNISEDLQTLVVFSKSTYRPEDPEGMVFNMPELRSDAKPDENVWNQFMDVATMRFGLYLLPQKLGGDEPLVHEVDEINLVIRGSSQFSIDDKQIEVHPGSIVWVKSGAKHNFHTIQDKDLEVLILFHRRNWSSKKNPIQLGVRGNCPVILSENSK